MQKQVNMESADYLKYILLSISIKINKKPLTTNLQIQGSTYIATTISNNLVLINKAS